MAWSTAWMIAFFFLEKVAMKEGKGQREERNGGVERKAGGGGSAEGHIHKSFHELKLFNI